MKYINKNGDIVELVNRSAINKYGNKLLWARCANGNVVSVWENAFRSDFSPVS